jgi:carboxypeptidase C (cathepsin A)
MIKKIKPDKLKVFVIVVTIVLFTAVIPPAFAQGANAMEAVAAGKSKPPIVTAHEIRIGQRTLKYHVTTGMMPLRNEQGITEANIFFMAYTLDDVADVSRRPLMFSFNGGPGSSSVWLHLGMIGPRRVQLGKDGWMPPAPYKLVDNDQTWLDFTDVVFIDPVGTGYSRAANDVLEKKFWSFQGDVRSMGDFIRLYLTRYERWSSPLFLVGESYGTLRAAGLASHLADRGIALNGIVFDSLAFDGVTTKLDSGNDLPFVLLLPTYTATAWYHKKLAPELQTGLRRTLDEAEHWASTEYLTALAKGDRLTPEEFRKTAVQLARFTGLSQKFVEQHNLRVEFRQFSTELLRDEGKRLGRLDTRITGVNDTRGLRLGSRFGLADSGSFNENLTYDDPAIAAIRPPYTSMLNDYVRRELGYKTDLEYFILGGGVDSWSFNSDNRYIDASRYLRSAFDRNPHMLVFVASGYYDASTPYYAAEYTLDHLHLPPNERKRISRGYYESGHMQYIYLPSLVKLTGDVRKFVKRATSQ